MYIRKINLLTRAKTWFISLKKFNVVR
jgi:hypothetical protein